MRDRGHLSEWELLVLLALMRVEDDSYGVRICREIETRTEREVVVGSVYATLERLGKRGLVASELGDPTPERGGRAKRYFRITSGGVRAVREAKQNLTRLWQGLRELKGGVA